MSVSESQHPAGWYPNPTGPGQRYWDGQNWTDQYRETSPPPPAPPPPAPPSPTPTASAPTAAVAAPPAGVAAPPAAVAAPAAAPFNVYSDAVDLNQALTPEQRASYQQHQLTAFPTWAFVLLSILTLGIFGSIYHLLKHGRLPVVRHDDPSAGKAIGFSFIPLFNIYWYFVVWPRLIDRINLQYRLRGHPAPVNRSLAMTGMILNTVGFLIFGIGIIVGAVMVLIVGAQIQTAANELAEGRA